ncbi:hypothetical protein FUAX_25790 [Fulvitalea axinellae]|uniref:LysM domain-containing protein n=1 Tax=Fulvitalea axinellae TaxID=1182444 RepID=A0AAU9CXG9_9BACT|nr:hypothetical protein FUAX_25790 [Fulvitalea axinellae]
MRTKRLVMAFLCVFVVVGANAQDKQKKKRKGWFSFLRKKPKVEKLAVPADTIPEFFPEEFSWDVDSTLREALAVEDSLPALEDVEPCFFDISDNLSIDCGWLEAHDYFKKWDKRNINPYKIDALKFKDSLSLELYRQDDSVAWKYPIKVSKLTSDFGWRRWRWHYGVDLRLKTGDPIVAAFDGIVRLTRYDRRGYGYYVLLRHKNGLETLYGHMSKILVKVGQEVKAGELVGKGGSTGRSSGPHLHFEARYAGLPIDPKRVFDFSKGEIKGDTLEVTPETFAYFKKIRQRTYHRIRSGDTLSRLAVRYHTSITKICRLNGISRNKILRIGQRLRVR